MHRGSTHELWRYLYESLGDQNRHRIEIAAVNLEPEALALERDSSTPAEWVAQGRWVATARTTNFGTSLSQHLLVIGVLPLH